MSDELTKPPTLTKDQLEGLRKLREPFPPEQISKLPKPTRKQTDDLKANYKNGIRCQICGGWHHKDVVHLDYVGHAALTSRLLDADPLWNWEPFATEENGSPKLDNTGGMWGWLTVCGLTRRGYGDSDGKSGCNANKERVGDFLRNAAMRFGAAIDLWSKADLTKIDGAMDADTQEPKTKQPEPEKEQQQKPTEPRPEKGREKVEACLKWLDDGLKGGCTREQFIGAWEASVEPIKKDFTTDHWNELVHVKNDTTSLLMEKESKK